jgi:hypothetical protein
MTEHDRASAAHDEGRDNTTDLASATGWHQDPYGRNDSRWISAGRPTRLVRDGDVTSNDDPPAEPFDGALVALDEVPVQHETVRAGEDTDPKLGPILIVYNSSM